MKASLTKATYSKQATTIFAVIFALMAILGFMSIMTPESGGDSGIATETLPIRTNYSGYLLRVVVVTVTMIVVLIFGLQIYKKQIKLKGKNNLTVNFQGRHYLNDKQYLLKLEIEGKQILLGVSETSINFLTELKPDEDMDETNPSFGTVMDLETNKGQRV